MEKDHLVIAIFVFLAITAIGMMAIALFWF
jgi:hypothetical protein